MEAGGYRSEMDGIGHGGSGAGYQDREPEDVIAIKEFYAERKRIRLELRENRSGRFVRITEGRKGMVLIPEVGIAEFIGALQGMAGA